MLKHQLLFLSALFLSACGGGSNSNETRNDLAVIEPPREVFTLNGVGVKGALANARVKLFAFDSTKEDGLGRLVIEGDSDEKAKMRGISVNAPLNEFYVIEYTKLSNTIDLSTGQSPVLSKLRKLITSNDISSGKELYTTPLSTFIFSLALENWDREASLNLAVDEAENTVRAILGLGFNANLDLIDTPPIFTDETVSQEQKIASLSVRLINEAMVSLIYESYKDLEDRDITTNDILVALAKDISDGQIDAYYQNVQIEIYSPSNLQIFKQNLLSLPIPSTDGFTVFDTLKLMSQEVNLTANTQFELGDFSLSEVMISGTTIATKVDNDADGVINFIDDDDDNDGVLDLEDIFPFDASESKDFDLDGIGDVADTDDDGDGVLDENDAFPLNTVESIDFDGDGIGNVADEDDDGDGISDIHDAFPLDPLESADLDLDGIGNSADTDDDGDGVNDVADIFPLDPHESADFDGDGIGDVADTDDDGDGVVDVDDAFPFDPLESVDFDLDGIGNVADTDDDGDGASDEVDAFPFDPAESADFDLDGIGDVADTDDDGDGVSDVDDSFPFDASEIYDFDEDGMGDVADTDDDNDGINDTEDKLTIVGNLKSEYSPNELINIRVRGDTPEGKKLTASDGWHTQFYIANSEDPNVKLSQYVSFGTYNAEYNFVGGHWNISFNAPRYAGNFIIDIALYCSVEPSSCFSQSSEHTIDDLQFSTELIEFSVTCPEMSCPYVPEVIDAVKLSDSIAYADHPEIIKRNNGELLAVYKDDSFPDGNVIARSNDDGATWEYIGQNGRSATADLIETDDGLLVALNNCWNGPCLSHSINGVDWVEESLWGMIERFDLPAEAFLKNHFTTSGIIQTQDAGFLVSFTYRPDIRSSESKLYVAKSYDFVTWSEPVLVKASSTFTGYYAIHETLEGGYLLATQHINGPPYTQIFKSDDGINWSFFDETERSFGYINFIENKQGVDIFYSKDNSLYKLPIGQSGIEGERVELHTHERDIIFTDVDRIDEDTFGLIFTTYINNKLDVFFKLIDDD